MRSSGTMRATLTGASIALVLAIAPHAMAQSEIRGAGATFPAAVYTSWGFTYQKEKKVPFIYQATGSGDGVRQIVARAVDFGASDVPVPADQLKKEDLVQFPTLVGAVVPVVNIAGIKPGELKLAGPLLAKIFSGQITTWNDPEIRALNPALQLPKQAIKRLVRSDNSGTTATFTEYLSLVSSDWHSKVGSGLSVKWPGSVDLAQGTDKLAALSRETPGSITYVSLNVVRSQGLAFVQMQNRSGQFVAPSEETLSAAVSASGLGKAGDETASLLDMPGARAWPITDATYIVMERRPRNPQRAKQVLNFFYWVFLQGDAMASETGFVPLPGPVQARVVARFRKVENPDGSPLEFLGKRQQFLAAL
ncbi:MAG TPA: phosphate ABC transporter substrate-binding protein PstS [Burkholderiales bacterium]|nr:phosphate ABC transporter substrate-binding protein PstS [Burkholderiales bacterium]